MQAFLIQIWYWYHSWTASTLCEVINCCYRKLLQVQNEVKEKYLNIHLFKYSENTKCEMYFIEHVNVLWFCGSYGTDATFKWLTLLQLKSILTVFNHILLCTTVQPICCISILQRANWHELSWVTSYLLPYHTTV